MSKVTIENTKAVLESALQESVDSEQKYKIRTALQFLEVLQQQEDEVVGIVEQDCSGDPEVFDRLRELGYLE